MSEKAHSTVNGIHGSNRTASVLLKDLDDYFVCIYPSTVLNSTHLADGSQIGPRDLEQHSRWPVFLRLHGSVTPEMVMPLFFIGGWSTMITLISKFVFDRT
jgi:hypothetical protein